MIVTINRLQQQPCNRLHRSRISLILPLTQLGVIGIIDVGRTHGVVGSESVDSGGITDPVAHVSGNGEKPETLLIAENFHKVIHFADMIALLIGPSVKMETGGIAIVINQGF